LREKSIGWINKKEKQFLKFHNFDSNFIDGKKLILILKKKLFTYLTKKNSEQEFCPVFNFNALNPKLNFCHKKPFGQKNIFTIERELLSFFGFPQYGIHGNGWTEYKNRIFFHFSIRSKNLNHFPGQYDNLFAGGQPQGISILKNLKKEAFEEVGLKINTKNLVRGSTVNYFHDFLGRIHSGIIFIYHLKIKKKNFVNIDGEVERFETIDAFEIYKLLESKKLKPNCIIPIADFFLRNMNDLFPKKGILEIERLLKNGRKIKSL
jgi:hypothetical protein|tara:strand:- start:2389 stop:3180 length:792 start_codon:yes stop_codon:yes gene_type:complete